jgi:hypothetical protein
LKPFDVLQRARAGTGKSGRLAPNRDDEPEALDRGEPAEKCLDRARVLAPGRLQIVEDRERQDVSAGGGDIRLHFGGRARRGKAEMGGEAA